jgi:hypothetical protein
MLNFAKCVTNGVIPLGGVICRDKLYDAMMKTDAPEHVVEFFHGYTYSGHPVACAAAIATLELFSRKNLFARAGEMGKVLGDAFHSAFKGLPNVISIRSLGLAAAVELAPIAGAGQARLRHLPGLLPQGRAGAASGRRAGDRAALHRGEVAHRHAGEHAGGFDQEARLSGLFAAFPRFIANRGKAAGQDAAGALPAGRRNSAQ